MLGGSLEWKKNQKCYHVAANVLETLTIAERETRVKAKRMSEP